MQKIALLIVFFSLFISPLSFGFTTNSNIKIAFLPDVHFHDVYGSFSDKAFAGVPIASNKNAVIRSMAAQLHSTRLFNENYFAFKQALDNLVEQGIKLVVLPGDFTDDGQPIHLRGLSSLLNHYQQTYGMRFFATNGNHDPNRPVDVAGGKSNFLGEDGREVAIFSRTHKACVKQKPSPSLICSDEVKESGYKTVLTYLNNFGFFPSRQDSYWATPFSSYSPTNYTIEQATDEAKLESRFWSICNQSQRQLCANVTDTSYVVEPVNGLWLLAIDANVYVPEKKLDAEIVYSGSGNQGYNGVVTYKPQLLRWVKTVVKQAKEHNKTLIAFSHFPMAPFYDGQEHVISQLLGENAMQMVRSPNTYTVEKLLDTGVKIHIGGHMHINDTQSVTSEFDDSFVNVQAPSLAAYRPAYKLVEMISKNTAKVSTIPLEKVSAFDSFFPLYAKEHEQLKRTRAKNIWDKSILKASTYHKFADQHLRELVRLRFFPNEWNDNNKVSLFNLNTSAMSIVDELFASKIELTNWFRLEKLHNTDLQWTLLDMLHDLYRYRNAGSLAEIDVTLKRKQCYQAMYRLLDANQENLSMTQQSVKDVLMLMQGFSSGESDDAFVINLTTGKVEQKEQKSPEN